MGTSSSKGEGDQHSSSDTDVGKAHNSRSNRYLQGGSASSSAAGTSVPLSQSIKRRCCGLCVDSDFVVTSVINPTVWDAQFSTITAEVPRVKELEAKGFGSSSSCRWPKRGAPHSSKVSSSGKVSPASSVSSIEHNTAAALMESNWQKANEELLGSASMENGKDDEELDIDANQRQRPQQSTNRVVYLTSHDIVGMPLSNVLGNTSQFMLIQLLSASTNWKKQTQEKKNGVGDGGYSGVKNNMKDTSAPSLSFRWQLLSSLASRQKGVETDGKNAAHHPGAGGNNRMVSLAREEYILFLPSTASQQGDKEDPSSVSHQSKGGGRRGRGGAGISCCSVPIEDHDEEDVAGSRGAGGGRRRLLAKNERTIWFIPQHFAVAEKQLQRNSAQIYECVQCKGVSLDTAEDVYSIPTTLFPYLVSNGITLLHNISLTNCSRCLESLREATANSSKQQQQQQQQQQHNKHRSTVDGNSFTSGTSACGETEAREESVGTATASDHQHHQQHHGASFWVPAGGNSSHFDFDDESDADDETIAKNRALRQQDGRRGAGGQAQQQSQFVGEKGKVGSIVSTSLFARREGTGRMLGETTPSKPPVSKNEQQKLMAEERRRKRRNSIGEGNEDDDGSPLALAREASAKATMKASAATSGPQFSSLFSSSTNPQHRSSFRAGSSGTSSGNIKTVLYMIEDKTHAAIAKRALMNAGLLTIEVSTAAELDKYIFERPNQAPIAACIFSVFFRGVSVQDIVGHLKCKESKKKKAMKMAEAEARAKVGVGAGKEQATTLGAPLLLFTSCCEVPPIVAIGTAAFSSTALDAGCTSFIPLLRSSSSSSPSAAKTKKMRGVSRPSSALVAGGGELDPAEVTRIVVPLTQTL